MFTIGIVGLTVLANVVIGLVAIKRNPGSATNRLIALLSLITALWTVFNYLALVPGISEAQRLFWVRIVMLSTAPYGTVILLMADAFPGLKINYSAKFVWGLVVFNLVTMILAVSPYMFTHITNTSETNFNLYPGPAIIVYAIGFMGFMGAGFVKLFKKHKVNVGVLKTQMWLFLVGLILSFTLLTLTNFVAVVVFGSIQLTSFGPPFTLIFFGFVLYAIIRHKFLDINAFIVRAVSFTLLLLSVVGVEVGLVWGLTRILPLGTDMVMVAMGGAILIVMGYDRLRELISKLTEKIFFRGRYDTEEVLKQLTRVMAGEIEIELLWKQMQAILQQELKLTKVELIWGEQDKKVWADWKLEKLCIFDEMEEGEQKEWMRARGLRVVIPLLAKGELVGVVTLGEKSSGEIYSTQDLQLLEILAPQAAIAIKNAQRYHQIQEFNRTLEARVEERTREMMSSQERELQKTTELLKLKNEFVFMASHDIATPVAAISGYMALIKESKDKLTSEMRENLEAIGESTERLKSLVNDLLQIARGESGTMRVVQEKVDLTVLLQNVERRVELLARDREVKVSVEQVEIEIIESDGQKLMEILENLLTNAIRYRLPSGEGWVKIRVTKGQGGVGIAVEDNGFGIPRKEQVKVFTKFFRSERKEVREQPGTGLGLYVSQMLSNNLGGKITFVSEEGRGSTFTLTLPLEQSIQKGVILKHGTI